MTERTQRDLEEMASRFLDGEIAAEDREDLLSLIAESPDFRGILRDYRDQDGALADTGAFVPPPCPSPSSRRGLWARLLVPALASAAAVMLFVAGAWFGQSKALNRVPSFARVAAPAAWIATELSSDGQDFTALTGLITHYQAEVARQLEKAQPDWNRIRDLMVTLGSLRTDLELLSLHERYQKDPLSGVSDWRRMLGMTEGESASL